MKKSIKAKRRAALGDRKSDVPLWSNTPKMLNVFARVAEERVRQKQLFAAGKITFDCASVIPDPNRKFRVLVEEVGEVAQELDRLEQLRDRRGEVFVLEDLQDELTQVAAVAVAWLESFEPRQGNEGQGNNSHSSDSYSSDKNRKGVTR